MLASQKPRGPRRRLGLYTNIDLRRRAVYLDVHRVVINSSTLLLLRQSTNTTTAEASTRGN